jgi:hypothetical protein
MFKSQVTGRGGEAADRYLAAAVSRQKSTELATSHESDPWMNLRPES